MNPVCTAQEIRSIDRRVIEEVGIPGMVLMERAGILAAEIGADLLAECGGESVAIFCGRGNNGGDGFVVARELTKRGFSVQIFLFGDPDTLSGDAFQNYVIVSKLGISITVINSEQELPKCRITVDLVVDALLGTGGAGPVKEIIGGAIRIINEMQCSVLSIDLPSGVNTDTGECLGECVHADSTVTMGLLKRGLCLPPGREYAGRVYIADIGFPQSAIDVEKISTFQPDDDDILLLFPTRESTCNKTQAGKILILAGSQGLTGAAALSSEGAMRAGAGLVLLGIPKSLNPIVEIKLTETMTLPLPETSEMTLSFAAKQPILDRISWATVVAMGPGLSRHEETKKLVRQLVKEIQLPMVLDADALYALSPYKKYFPLIEVPVVITPHEGEFSRLMDLPIEQVRAGRIEISRKAAELLRVTVVLKGSPTIVASPFGTVCINPTGNAGMATGGVGDVLTGIIAGFMGQGLDPFSAAVVGVYLHGRAGDILSEKTGELGLLASDLPRILADAMQSVHPQSETNDL